MKGPYYMTRRRFGVLFVALLLVLCLERGITVHAFQKIDEPEWAQRIESQHMVLMDKLEVLAKQVYLDTGTFTQRLDGIDNRVTNLAVRLTNDEAGGTEGARVEIASLRGTTNLLVEIVSAIFVCSLSLIAGGLGSVWWYSKRARKLADQLEEHRVDIASAVADKLEAHRSAINEKLSTLTSQTNGMSERLQQMAEDKGIQEGRDQVLGQKGIPNECKMVS